MFLEEDNAFPITENQDMNKNEDILEDGGDKAGANIYTVDVSAKEVEGDLRSLEYCR